MSAQDHSGKLYLIFIGGCMLALVLALGHGLMKKKEPATPRASDEPVENYAMQQASSDARPPDVIPEFFVAPQSYLPSGSNPPAANDATNGAPAVRTEPMMSDIDIAEIQSVQAAYLKRVALENQNDDSSQSLTDAEIKQMLIEKRVAW